MLYKLFRKVYRNSLEKDDRVKYENGASRGYQLGWQMRQVEDAARGLILAAKVDEEVAGIIKKEGF